MKIINKSHKKILVIVCFIFLLILKTIPGICSDELDRKPVKIDFNNVIKNEKSSESKSRQNSLRIAVAAMISPDYTYNSYTDLLTMIGKQMGKEAVFIQKKTYAEVNTMLEKKQIDIAFVCSGPYVEGKKKFGMEILVVPVCYGETVYYSYFITSKDSGITSIEELKGKTFAFTDPMSNTGYLVPNYFLAKRKESADKYFKKTFFTHSHDNSIRAVANRIADGAAVDSLIYDYMLSKNPKLFRNIMIIEKSPPYGIPPVVVHPSMNSETKQKIKNIFLNIHKNSEGKRILKNLRIDRFVNGNDADYATVRALQNYLKTENHFNEDFN